VGWALVRIGSGSWFLAGVRRAAALSRSVRAQALGDTTRVVAQQFRSGFWFKQDQTFVNIRSVLADLTLVGISIYEFDDDFRLRTVRTADAGSFAGNGQWHLKAVRNTEIALTGTKTTQADTFTWHSVLRPSLLTVYQVAPEKLELNTLWEIMQLLGAGTQKTTRFEIAFGTRCSTRRPSSS
jgi:lipopolysaccharide export system permease protein